MIFNDSQNNGFVQVRRNVLNHLTQGWLTHDEYFLFTGVLLLLADASTGSVTTTNEAIHVALRGGEKSFPLARVKRAMHGLEKKNYIRREYTPGTKGWYPIYINKFPVTVGPMKGNSIVLPEVETPEITPKNAEKSVPKRAPIHEPLTAPFVAPLPGPFAAPYQVPQPAPDTMSRTHRESASYITSRRLGVPIPAPN
jgi:hypothetical protein